MRDAVFIKSYLKSRLYKFDGQSIEDSSAEAAIYGITARLFRDYGGLNRVLEEI